MSLIIPFEEAKLYKNQGAFIDQNGEIIFTYGRHEIFAHDFCVGENYQLLSEVKYGSGQSYYASHFEEFKKYYNFEGERKDIDVYKSSKLTKEQLELYKLWLGNYKHNPQKLNSDFLVYLLGFDKVQTVTRRAIITTSPQPHIKYYNYYLMDWHIECETPMNFNKDTGRFEYNESEDRVLKYLEDIKVEEEIGEIKSNVLLKDRHLFFK